MESLAKFAESQFRLDKVPQGSKQTLRASLEQVHKSTGKKPKQLADVPDPPPELLYVWEWFLDLRSMEPLTYTEIHNWASITQHSLQGWEAELLRSLDRIYRRVRNE